VVGGVDSAARHYHRDNPGLGVRLLFTVATHVPQQDAADVDPRCGRRDPGFSLGTFWISASAIVFLVSISWLHHKKPDNWAICHSVRLRLRNMEVPHCSRRLFWLDGGRLFRLRRDFCPRERL
jgi:hypothetical protein